MQFKKGNVVPNWDISVFNDVAWCAQPFNDSSQYSRWVGEGYPKYNTIGVWVDITSREFPQTLKDTFSNWDGLNDIGLTVYKMTTAEILPVHFDTYSYYKKIFKLGPDVDIFRTIVMLDDWRSGHYFEIAGQSFTHWKAGDWFTWANDTPHMAANIGLDPRFTLQITGWRQKNLGKEQE
jgi:hypothetical protein